MQSVRSRRTRSQAERSAGACRGRVRARPTRWPTARAARRRDARARRRLSRRASRARRRAVAARSAWSSPAREPRAPKPSSISRTTSPPRHRAGGARGHALDRTHQALHHDRHGDRPGQDVQHQRAGDRGARRSASRSPQVGLTTFRPPYTPVTFGAFAGRRARRAVRSGARDAAARLGGSAHGAVFEEVGPVEARLAAFPAPAKRAASRRARMPGAARHAPA